MTYRSTASFHLAGSRGIARGLSLPVATFSPSPSVKHQAALRVKDSVGDLSHASVWILELRMKNWLICRLRRC